MTRILAKQQQIRSRLLFLDSGDHCITMYSASNNNMTLPHNGSTGIIMPATTTCKVTLDDNAVYSVGKRRKAKTTLNTNSPGFMTAGDTNVFFPDVVVETTGSICSLNLLPEIAKSSTASSSSIATATAVGRTSDSAMGATSREPPDDDDEEEEAEDSDVEDYTLVNSPPATTTNTIPLQHVNAAGTTATINNNTKSLYGRKEMEAGTSVLNIRYVAGFSASTVYDMTATTSDDGAFELKNRGSTTCRLRKPPGGAQIDAGDCPMTMYDAEIVSGCLEAPALRYGLNNSTNGGGSVSRTSSTSVDREEADDDDDYDARRPSAASEKQQAHCADVVNLTARSAVRQKPQQSPVRKIMRSPARSVGKSPLTKPVARQQHRITRVSIATQTSNTPTPTGTPRSDSGRRKSGKPSPIRDIPAVPDAPAMSADGVLTGPSQLLFSTQDRVSDALSPDHDTTSRSKSPDRRATTRELVDEYDFAAAVSASGRRMRPSRKAAPKSFAHWTEYFSSNREADDEVDGEAGGAAHERRQRDEYYSDKDRAVEITTSMLRDLQADDEEEEYQLPEKQYEEDDSVDDDAATYEYKQEGDEESEYNFGRRRSTMNATTKAGSSSSARRGVKRKRAHPPLKLGKADVSNFPCSTAMYGEADLSGSDGESETHESYKDRKKKLGAYEVDQLLYRQKESDLKRNFACPDCGKSYTTPSNLTRHRQVHRNPDDDNSARQCPKCGKKYLSIPAFAMHMLSHKKSYGCRMCPKHFSRQWLLHCHERTHTGEKPYVCPVKSCSRCFADHSNYRAHVQTHNESKTFACQVCNKSFNLKSYLTKHQKGSGHRNNKRRLVVASHRHHSVVDGVHRVHNHAKEFKQEEVDSGHVESLLDSGCGRGSAHSSPFRGEASSSRADREVKTPTKSKKRSASGKLTPTPTKKQNSPKKIAARRNNNTINIDIDDDRTDVDVKNADALLLLAAAMHVERSSSFADRNGNHYADVLAEARTPPLSPSKRLIDARTPPQSPPKKLLVEVRTPPMSPPKKLIEPRTPPMSPPKRLLVAVDAGTPPMSPPKKLADIRSGSSSRAARSSSSCAARATATTPPFSPAAIVQQAKSDEDNVMEVQTPSPKTPPSVAEVMLESVQADMPRLSIEEVF